MSWNRYPKPTVVIFRPGCLPTGGDGFGVFLSVNLNGRVFNKAGKVSVNSVAAEGLEQALLAQLQLRASELLCDIQYAVERGLVPFKPTLQIPDDDPGAFDA